MCIRKARPEDSDSIVQLPTQLGYPDTDDFIADKIYILSSDPNTELLLYEADGKVLAIIAISFIVQLGLRGDFARISYFSVDSDWRSKGIGKDMEEYLEGFALEKKCDRIELHCSENRRDAHRFYSRHGYQESPKCLMKRLK
jgi:GNAT superfamily N-acetyltransferase